MNTRATYRRAVDAIVVSRPRRGHTSAAVAVVNELAEVLHLAAAVVVVGEQTKALVLHVVRAGRQFLLNKNEGATDREFCVACYEARQKNFT
jgi:hypothetical protein